MLYQQTNKIEIVVRKSGGGTALQGAGEKSAEEEQGKQSSSSGVGTKFPMSWDDMSEAQKSRFKRVNLTHAGAVWWQSILLSWNYHTQGTGYSTGDNAYQDLVQRGTEKITDVVSYIASVGIGATYGASGGLPGILAGASLAIVSTTASMLVKYGTRERDYSMKTFKLNNSISYLKSRSDINLTTGRLR